jgi:hypothetical protein
MGLILPFRPNKLAFPGTMPGFDPTHPASAGVPQSSVVCQSNNFVNLLTGAPGIISGTASGAVPICDSLIGPAIRFDGTNVALISTPRASSNVGVTNYFTAAAIVKMLPFNDQTSYIVATYMGGTGGFGFGLFSGDFSVSIFVNGGSSVVISPALTAGHKYFMAVSVAGAVPSANCVIRDLSSGTIFTSSTGLAGTTTGTDSNTAVQYGNRDSLARGFDNGAIAAGMLTYSQPSQLSIPQLLQWSQDPWSFWYPQKFDLAAAIGPPGGVAPVVTVISQQQAATWRKVEVVGY